MKNKPILPCPNIHALPEYEQLWLLARSAQFDLIDGIEVPTWSYREIARNFTKSRRFRVSKFGVRRFVLRMDPDLAKRRGNSCPFAVRMRKPVRSAWMP